MSYTLFYGFIFYCLFKFAWHIFTGGKGGRTSYEDDRAYKEKLRKQKEDELTKGK